MLDIQMIDRFLGMGGGPFAEGEVPYYYYYPHGTYLEGAPLSSRSWLPAYTLSASPRRGNGGGYYHFDDGDFGYSQDDPEVYFVDFPARKRKLSKGTEESNLRAAEVSGGGKFSLERNGRVEPTSERKHAQSNAGSGSFVVPVEGSSKDSTSLNVEKSLSQPMEIVESSPTLSPAHTEKVMATAMATEPSRRPAASLEGAAVAVQSFYRGYMARRTKPLEQLRVIATIRAQLTQLEGKAADPDFIEFIREHISGRLKLSENIMKLLFQLDGIQGANSEVRDIRKSLTRKVIAFQEQVDKLLSGSEDDVMDVDAKHDADEPKLYDEVSQRQGAVGGEPQFLLEESDPSVTAAFTNGTSLQRDVSINDSDMNVDKSSYDRVQNNVQSRLGETAQDSGLTEDTTRQGETNVDLVEDDGNELSSSGITEGFEAAILVDGGVEDVSSGQFDAGNNVSDTTRGQEESDSATLMTDAIHLDNGMNDGSLKEWRDVHVDDRTNRREDDAVDTTMLKAPGEDDERNTGFPPSQDGSEKQCAESKEPLRTRDDVSKYVVDYEAPKLAPMGDITAGAAAIDGSILPDFQKCTASLQEKDDKVATLRKLSEENQMLKALLLGVMKWNQLQAGSMNDLSNRLGNLEQHCLKSHRRSRRTAEDDIKQLAKLLDLSESPLLSKKLN